jgi:hypothetical protein
MSATALLVLMGLLPGADDKVDAKTLALVRDGHRASCRAIRTLQTRFGITYPRNPARTQPPASPIDVEWYQVVSVGRDPPGEIFRKVQRQEGLTTEMLWVDGVMKTFKMRDLGAKGVERRGSLVSNKLELGAGLGHPWVHGLLRVPLHTEGTYDEALGRPKRVKSVARVQVNGRTLYHVRFSTRAPRGNRKLDHDAWFDPACNFLVRKAICTSGDYRFEAEVLNFSEVKRGLYFPSVVVVRISGKQGLINMIRTTFTSVRINDPVAPSALELKFPKGTKVTDTIKATSYLTDADEKPAGKVFPIKVKPAPPVETGIPPERPRP